MRRGVTVHHHEDKDGKPTGGHVVGPGFDVALRGVYGADVADLVDAANQRVTYLAGKTRKGTKKMKAYAEAQSHLKSALDALDALEEDA